VKWYEGQASEGRVWLDHIVRVYTGTSDKVESKLILQLAPSLELVNHSPDGFNWGYSGSGPAQLALALLLDVLEDGDKAVRLHQLFKERVVANWRQLEDWMITENEIRRIVEELECDAGMLVQGNTTN
jgi:hypothetical protein